MSSTTHRGFYANSREVKAATTIQAASIKIAKSTHVAGSIFFKVVMFSGFGFGVWILGLSAYLFDWEAGL
ncbi:hypothetical protein RQM65_10485 [Pricia sp. S334]|uniref:Uncharacterized protein n=1 Tax=Pricia mediterranea TaxID=3076079 RepID=A0ABU3L5S1_9FLAO|nr:hypothetical protein [Pricia sp. S334]MDT7829091.1 hypothetical protein [Pricia sp. S334]